MRRSVLVCAVVLAGCGSGDAPPPANEEGRQVVEQSGCLACHRIGDDGTDGPGPDLTRVGARLSRAEIRRTLRKPKAPMPSYDGIPPARRDALVDYLAALR